MSNCLYPERIHHYGLAGHPAALPLTRFPVKTMDVAPHVFPSRAICHVPFSWEMMMAAQAFTDVPITNVPMAIKSAIRMIDRIDLQGLLMFLFVELPRKDGSPTCRNPVVILFSL